MHVLQKCSRFKADFDGAAIVLRLVNELEDARGEGGPLNGE